MKKFKIITLSSILLTSGCKNYVPYSYVDHIVSMTGIYCTQSGFPKCEDYRSCVSENYERVKSKAPMQLGMARIIIIQGSPNIVEKNDYTDLIKNSYNLLDHKQTNIKVSSLNMGVSYLIYAHNACASITGDKTYNIDSYMPLLREKLGVK
ncbi:MULTISPECIES: hypothetical protein [Serratia]|uniref:Lipoprotein n=1 Tax=Serratia fonticola TaxID=47917 RepID=A0AAW3X039_SERFO|nr:MULTISPECIES: hypothetical protein [Serratia]MBC3215192.1 hypothetical protein [Serratia fonticola]NYA15804.1 hypothetical protein [Serratia fonticola]NYA35924.1 hypothetical protein [Serratia fonticola]UAN55311.1 hypothetical protein KGP21_16525 [Serratia sp. JSRIV004]